MKALVLGAAILAAATTVAQADSLRVRNSMAQMPHQQRAHKSMIVANDVVVDGRVVGRDPSQHVRAAIANEHYSLGAAGIESSGDAGGGAASQ